MNGTRIRELIEGSPPETLRHELGSFLEQLEARNYSVRSRECYFYDCREFADHMKNAHGVVQVRDLLKRHLDAWFRWITERSLTRDGSPLKARTVNKKIASVGGLLRHLAERALIHWGIADSLRPVKEPDPLPTGIVPHDQVRRIFDSIDTGTPEGCRDRAILEVLYSCGLRVSEASGLDLDDVDFDNDTLKVFGKGRKERLVPLGKTAALALKNYVRGVRSHIQAAPEPGALFLNGGGTRVGRHTVAKMIRRRFPDEDGGGTRITPHSFRRSCATEMIRAGANVYHVKDILGHASLNTMKHYVRLNIEDLKTTHRKCHPREREGKEEVGE
jgi:site-specific recombinase XerD